MLNRCPICDSDDFEHLYARMVDYEYHVPYEPELEQCQICRVVRQKPVPGYDELTSFYPEDYMVYNLTPLFSREKTLYTRLKAVLYSFRAKRVASAIGKSGRVLDVGCAKGNFLLSLKPLGDYALYGLDIKRTDMDYEACGISFQEGHLETLSYPENFFDAIVLDNVIEHVPDPVVFMEKTISLLKPGGYLFGTTPNYNSLDRLMFGKYWGGFHMPRHIYIFNDQNIRRILEKVGFTYTEIPATANAGDWAVSFQNFIRRNKNKTKPYKRALYFSLVAMSFAPLSVITSACRRNGVMDFISRKAM